MRGSRGGWQCAIERSPSASRFILFRQVLIEFDRYSCSKGVSWPGMDPCARESDDGVCGIMKTMAKEPLQVLALVGAMVMISGCMIKPYVLTDEDVRTRATNDLQIVSTLREPLSGPIDL